jgi:uncharacterized protein with NRDE domain
MCLILFAYKVHPVFPLIVAANRDEFYKRSTAPAHFWDDNSEILAGRDLEKMGTWMGVNRSGQFSALTNFRNPNEVSSGKRSRGELVANALKYKGYFKDYMQQLMIKNNQYPGYNLLAGDVGDLYYYSNIGQNLQKLESGIYGISNDLLNTEWPKVKIGKDGLTRIIYGNQDSLIEQLFTLLQKADPAPDDILPKTGVSLEWERRLSPLFIKSKTYGTRSSTIMLMSENEVQYMERVFMGEFVSDQNFKFSY